MRGPKTQFTDEQLLSVFVAKADKVLSHPLAVMEKPRMDLNLLVSNSPDKDSFQLDFLNAPEDSWQSLAYRIRPLIYLQRESLYIPNVMGRIEVLAPKMAEHATQLTRALAAWKTSVFFNKVDLGQLPPGEALPYGEHRVTDVYMGTPQEIEALIESEGGTMIPDYELADKVFYGDLFHHDDDKVLELESLTPLDQQMYAKAAETRARTSCYYIHGAKQLIQAGWDAGLLPARR